MLTVDPYSDPRYSCYTPVWTCRYAFTYFWMSFANLYQCLFILSLLPYMLQDWMKYIMIVHSLFTYLVLASRYRRFVTLYYHYSFWLIASMFLPLFTVSFNFVIFQLGSFSTRISLPLLIFMWAADVLSMGVMVYEIVAILKDSVALEETSYHRV